MWKKQSNGIKDVYQEAESSLDEKNLQPLSKPISDNELITWRGEQDLKRKDPATLEQGYMIMIFPFPF